MLYWHEVSDIVNRLNGFIPGETKLKMPDEKFHRAIGRYANLPYDADGNLLEHARYEKYLKTALPTPEDYAALKDIFKDPNWIADKPLPKDLWGYQENIRKATLGK
jgi:hypothetical protein